METQSLARTAVRRFIAGAALVAGGLTALGAASVVVPLVAEPIRQYQKKTEFTTNTGQLVVEKLEPLAITKQAGVVAAIRNNGTQKSRPDEVTLTIEKESKVLFACRVTASAFIAPGSTASEQLICQEVEREAVPIGATYKVHIAGAWNSK